MVTILPTALCTVNVMLASLVIHRQVHRHRRHALPRSTSYDRPASLVIRARHRHRHRHPQRPLSHCMICQLLVIKVSQSSGSLPPCPPLYASVSCYPGSFIIRFIDIVTIPFRVPCVVWYPFQLLLSSEPIHY